MEVTQEMIDAVEAHKQAEAKRLSDEYDRKWREYHERIDRELHEKVRALLPEVTDAQMDVLYGIYSDYFYELRG